MKSRISDEMKIACLHEAADSIIDAMKYSNRQTYAQAGTVKDIVYLSTSPDGGGNMYSERNVLHIREIIGKKPLLFGLLSKNIVQSLVMLEHGGEGTWNIHIKNDISNFVDTAIKPVLDTFSNKTGDKYQIFLDREIIYTK